MYLQGSSQEQADREQAFLGPTGKFHRQPLSWSFKFPLINEKGCGREEVTWALKYNSSGF